jgi:hypothetical protein
MRVRVLVEMKMQDREDIAAAVRQLRKSEAGREALRLIRPFFRDSRPLDCNNRDAVCDLVVAFLEGHVGSVIEITDPKYQLGPTWAESRMASQS